MSQYINYPFFYHVDFIAYAQGELVIELFLMRKGIHIKMRIGELDTQHTRKIHDSMADTKLSYLIIIQSGSTT